ncbi:MAG: hypothetical protein KME55_24060 [Nostoc indistinguendum CM1-VF10]|nr:hypothetical protein [Nostoc indistinguendum CM1-VF10]
MCSTGPTIRRSLAAPALSIFGGHSDVMAARGTGFASLSSKEFTPPIIKAVFDNLPTPHS